jgi:hypothetical protein
MWGLATATIRSASVPTWPDFAALFLPILAGCGSSTVALWWMPMSPMAKPTNNATRPRSVLLPSTALTVVKARTISMKSSGGPRRMAYSATSGAQNVTSTVAIVPAVIFVVDASVAAVGNVIVPAFTTGFVLIVSTSTF